MKSIRYKTQGTCSSQIEIDIEEGKIAHVNFANGCEGNLRGIARLVQGMPVDEAIARLQGIDCEGRGTSCPDQLAKALKQYKA
ncbi:TSCPD domain-containing protein [Bacteroidia bacterium]|nr:TSCPD domain-containing protein [Bacteroidia bacterium]